MCGYGAGETGKNRFCGEGQLRRCGSTEGCNPFVQVKGGSHYRVKDEVPWRVEGSQPHRVKGEAPWQVKGGSLAQGKLMLASTCTGYYLTQNFAGLAALPPSLAQNIFAGRRKNV